MVGRGGLTNYGSKRAWFGCPPKAAAFAKLLPTGSRRRKAGSEPPPPYKRHPKMGAFFSGGKGWITEPLRFSAWFGCPPKAAAFAKLLPTDSRRQKAGSEPPPPLQKAPKRCRLFVVGRGGFTNHCALARGSAVRRRRQLSRSCCQPTLEDKKREANLHPPYKRHPKGAGFLWWEGVDLRTTAL